MSDTVMDTVDVERMAFIEGDHGDPFSFLGMHTAGGEGHLVVRTFQPRADTVAVIDIAAGTAVAELDRVHPDGLFEGTIAGRQEAFAYRLAVTVDGTTSEIEDPYRFGAVLGSLDEHLLAEGNHLRAFDKMGAHVTSQDGVAGVSFAVWAPSARRASVVGDFNGWDGRCHPMRKRHGCGVWELFIPGLAEGLVYKYELKAANGTLLPLKADPFGFYAEQPPNTASRVYDLDKFEWQDQEWMARREEMQRWDRPISIYEVHLGSWRRVPDDGHRWLSYRELAETLVPYVKDMGFTHVELLPVSEYPFDGSWGYQPIGLYAPTSRHGDPDDFRHLVQAFHDAGIGVLIDWVAGHFPTDAHGLGYFDGTHLYEHADPRQGFHRDWNTLIYNYGRVEVANFLLANAAFWLEKYHIDGLRVDAVASMLYLDYSREGGDWIPNQYGGNENIEAIQFLRRMNELLYGGHSGAITMAEESTSWPMVSRPTSIGGLGFGFKWNMGWMHDTLRYMSRDPIHRRWHQDDMTFGLLYAFHENFILPLSHDEVVHGKGSLIGRMPGDIWQRFANLRAYYGFMWTHPGKKLLFMGGEIAQWREWHHNESLDWHLLDEPFHGGVQQLVRDLNRFYCATPALYEQDSEAAGFEWIDCHDSENSVVSYVRYARDRSDMAVVVVNLTPQVHQDYRIGVPAAGTWREVLNTDAPVYGGSGVANAGPVAARDEPWHNRPFSLGLTLPPLATIVLAPERAGRDAP